MAHRPGLVEADGTVDAQTAPTAPWQTLRVSHELPQRTVVIQSPTKNPEEPKMMPKKVILKVAQAIELAITSMMNPISSGSLIGVRNRTIERAPSNPSESGSEN